MTLMSFKRLKLSIKRSKKSIKISKSQFKDQKCRFILKDLIYIKKMIKFDHFWYIFDHIRSNSNISMDFWAGIDFVVTILIWTTNSGQKSQLKEDSNLIPNEFKA